MNPQVTVPSPAKEIVLPVGYQAAREPGSATTPPRIHVRVGTDYLSLDGREHVGLWLLAHGSWSTQRSGWTRADIIAAATERDIPAPDAAFDHLAQRGLIVRSDGLESARALAQRLRLRALLYGLGDIGDGVALAVADTQTRVRLEPRELAVWMHAPEAPTLWDSAVVGADSPTMDAFHPFRSVDELLTGVLAATQYLVSRGAAYLDRPLTPRPGTDS